MHNTDPGKIFEVFKEIGIIEQLSRARLEAELPDGLIAPHFAVLNHLINRGDGAVPIDMARAFQVPKTSMTHTLKGLVAQECIELRDNPKDGRSKTVWLMPKGRVLQGDMIAKLAASTGDLTSAVSLEEFEAILPVLTRLRIYLDAAREKP